MRWRIEEYFGLDREICSTRLAVDDFFLLELERDIAKLGSLRKEAEAEGKSHCTAGKDAACL